MAMPHHLAGCEFAVNIVTGLLARRPNRGRFVGMIGRGFGVLVSDSCTMAPRIHSATALGPPGAMANHAP
jgi:hypothetical protein